ncbi:hypothetical protein BJX96DRAFT_177760 [Aspergillus floccosus]
MCDISTVTSPLSSARTTPDLNLIDPRLLELVVSGEGGVTLANKVPSPPDYRLFPPNNNEDTRQDEKTVDQSCEHISSPCISGSACNHKDTRVVEPPASSGRAKPYTDLS